MWNEAHAKQWVHCFYQNPKQSYAHSPGILKDVTRSRTREDSNNSRCFFQLSSQTITTSHKCSRYTQLFAWIGVVTISRSMERPPNKAARPSVAQLFDRETCRPSERTHWWWAPMKQPHCRCDYPRAKLHVTPTWCICQCLWFNGWVQLSPAAPFTNADILSSANVGTFP